MPSLPERPSMRAPGGVEESFPTDAPALKALLAELERKEELWSAYIKELSALEDPAAGLCHAAPLHEARQYRMAIRYRKDFCLVRIRRLAG